MVKLVRLVCVEVEASAKQILRTKLKLEPRRREKSIEPTDRTLLWSKEEKSNFIFKIFISSLAPLYSYE